MKDGTLMQIGQVVRNIDATMERLHRDFGFGPFEIHLFDSKKVKDSMVRGKPSNHTYLCAACWFEGLQYELMQPLTGRSIYDEFLEARGEGLQHVKLYYKDVEKAVQDYLKKGYQVVQSGGIGDDLFYYLDTEKSVSGVCIELGNAGSNLPPPDRWYPAKP